MVTSEQIFGVEDKLSFAVGDLKLSAKVTDACASSSNRPFELLVSASNGEQVRKPLFGQFLGQVTTAQAKALLASTNISTCPQCGGQTIHMHKCYACVLSEIQ